ncbi:MAG: hypothetical protein IT323_08835, partial [Anaerolineae bacterium]|nr:hypothetical protein [Anaerolineae bacterium]
MDIKLLSGALDQAAVDAILVALFENGGDLSGAAETINTALGGALKDVLDAGDFTGKLSQTSVLYPRGALPARRVILIGLGKKDSFTADTLRRAMASAMQKARDLKAKTVASALVGAAELGARNAA